MRYLWGISRIVLLCFVTLALLEITIRIADPLGISDLHDQRVLWRDLIKLGVPPAGKHMRANARLKLSGWSVATNKYGFRDDDFSERKPRDEKRILFLGDSFVFGHGVPQNKVAAHLLEEDLERHTGHSWQVINTAVGSYATQEQWLIVEAYARRFDVDLILLLYSYNDCDPRFIRLSAIHKIPEYIPQDARPTPLASNAATSQSAFRAWLHNARMLAYPRTLDVLTWIETSRRQAPARMDFSESTWAWRFSMDNLLRIKHHCDHLGIPLLVAYMNHYGSGEPELINMRVGKALGHVCTTNGIPFYDLRQPSLRLRLADHRNSVVDGHPNAKGQEIIAAMLLEILEREITK